MKILILEYFLSRDNYNYKQASFYNEAINIFQAIINSSLKAKDIELYSWVNKSFKNSFENINNAAINISFSLDNFNNLKDYYKFLKNLKLAEIDYFLVIAPETNNILYKISKILEKKKIKNLGSSSKCIKKAANKWLLYQNFAGSKIALPETELINNQLIRENKINRNIFPAVIKEFYGAGSELIIINNYQALKKLNLNQNKNYLIQKIIKGTAGSISALANQEKTLLLTLNKQIINSQNFKYQGGIINYPFKNLNKLTEILNKIKEKYPGLKGYYGVDFICKNNNYYLLEINPRITSSFIGLAELYNPIKYITKLQENNNFPKLKNKPKYKFILD